MKAKKIRPNAWVKENKELLKRALVESHWSTNAFIVELKDRGSLGFEKLIGELKEYSTKCVQLHRDLQDL